MYIFYFCREWPSSLEGMNTTTTAEITRRTETKTNITKPDSTTVMEGETHLHETAATGLQSCPISFALTGLTMDMYLPVHPDEAQTRDNDNDMNATWSNHELFMAKRTAENHHKC